jgi:hypothetical protein
MGRFDSYSGLLTAFPYAFRTSESRLFRAYAVVSALLGGLFALMMVIAIVVLIGNTASAPGGSLTLSRTFYVVVGLFVFAPLVAPVLFVARRHRRGTPVRERYDAALGASGFLFALSVYLGVVASMPAQYRVGEELTSRPEPSGVFAPVIEALYALPPIASPVVPLAGALVVYLAHRRFRGE